MSETLLIFLIGGSYAFCFAATGGGILTMMRIYDRMALIDNESSKRISKLEAVLSMVADKAANILHSPHTPELDSLLEKYGKQNYSLTCEEWSRLIGLTDEIETDLSVPKPERVLAGFINAIARHKIKLSVSPTDKHEDSQ